MSKKKIKIFDINESSLKKLGHILRNDRCRKIIIALSKKEMYVNQISKELNIGVNDVSLYVKQINELGLLDVTRKPIVRKGNNHNFYKFRTDIFISINIDESKLKRIFKDGIKLTVIGVTSFFVWTIFDKSNKFLNKKITSNNKVYPLPEDSIFTIEPHIWIPVITIVCGILLIWFRKLRKKRK